MRKTNLHRSWRAPWNKLAGTNKHSRNARGLHVRNPGYKPGDNWIECQRCGMDVYASDAKEDGYREGLIVCPKCYDAPHPQDYVRAFEDTLKPADLSTGTDLLITTVEGEDINGDSLIWTEVNDNPTGSTEVPGPVGTTIETL